MSEEMKPCAHCGGKVKMRVVTFPDGDVSYCFDCKCSRTIIEATSKRRAIEAWNTRYEPTCYLIDCEREDGLNPEIGGRRCSSCGVVWYPENGVSGFRYCPNCCAKVVD